MARIFDSITDPMVSRLLQVGKVRVLPTDTVYGIVARAEDKEAVAKLYRSKHREGKPGTVIAANIGQLEALGVAREYLDTVAYLWPNEISVILPADATLDYVVQGKGSLAMRIPRDPALQQLLAQTGPLLTSSANMPGEPTAATIDDAALYFGDTIDFYVDGGTIKDTPSTIVLLTTDGKLELIRKGVGVVDL